MQDGQAGPKTENMHAKNRELGCRNRELEYGNRELECRNRELECRNRELEYGNRELEYGKGRVALTTALDLQTSAEPCRVRTWDSPGPNVGLADGRIWLGWRP